MNDTNQMTGIFEGLKDLSFSRLITPKLIKTLYIIMIVLAILSGLSMIIGGFGEGFLSGIGALIVAPLLVLLMIIGGRVNLELIMVIFRIEHNTAKIAGLQSQTDASTQVATNQTPPPPPAAEG